MSVYGPAAAWTYLGLPGSGMLSTSNMWTQLGLWNFFFVNSAKITFRCGRTLAMEEAKDRKVGMGMGMGRGVKMDSIWKIHQSLVDQRNV